MSEEDLMDEYGISYSDLYEEKADEEHECPYCSSHCMKCLGLSNRDFF
jgi:hypothetical protein